MGITAVTLLALFFFRAQPGAAGQEAPPIFLPLLLSSPGICYYTETDEAVVIELLPDIRFLKEIGCLTRTGVSLTKFGANQLNIRNSHPLSPTDFNDVWVRLDNRPWIKGFSNAVDTWTYDFNFDYGGGHLTAAEFFNVQPRLHTLELSAGFRLDRLVLYTNGMGQLDN